MTIVVNSEREQGERGLFHCSDFRGENAKPYEKCSRAFAALRSNLQQKSEEFTVVI